MKPIECRSLNSNLIGWFAIALSKELKQKKIIQGILANTPYVLSRSTAGIVTINNTTETIAEQNGIIYAWNHPKRLAPSWFIPILNEMDWSGFQYYQLTARTHPQEVYENSIDISHFSVVQVPFVLNRKP